MSRAALLTVLLLASSAPASDLPPGAVLRLGEDRLRTGFGGLGGLAVSPDGQQVATWRKAGAGRVALAVWDAETGCLLQSAEVDAKRFQGFAWGRRGALALATANPDAFGVWDFTDPKAAPLAPPGTGDPSGAVGPKAASRYAALVPSADGGRVAAVRLAGSGKFAIDVFELKADATARLTRVRSFDIDDEDASRERPPQRPLLSADGRTLVAFRVSPDEFRGAFNSAVYEARAFDVDTGEAGEWFLARGSVWAAGLAPDGRTLALPRDGDQGGVALIDPRTGKARVEIARPRWPGPDDDNRDGFWKVFFLPDGKRLLAVTGFGAVVLDAASGKELGRLEGHAIQMTDAAVSADGTRVATADGAGLVRLWDARTLRPLGSPAGHTAPVEHAEFSPDGKRVLTFAYDRTVRVWDAATGRELRAFAGVPWAIGERLGEPQRPSFTPDGLAVAFYVKDRLVARDVLTGLEVPAPPTAPGPRRGLAECSCDSPDGRQEAKVVGAPPRVHLRESATGAVRRTLVGHRGEVRVLGFSPDGTKLLTAGGDHTVLVWDVRVQAMPLTEAVKRETSAAKLWAALAAGKADEAYLAMARLAAEPGTAVKMTRLRVKPAARGEAETHASKLTDTRAVELLEALGTDESRALLKELAGGDPFAFRTREAKRALERNGK